LTSSNLRVQNAGETLFLVEVKKLDAIYHPVESKMDPDVPSNMANMSRAGVHNLFAIMGRITVLFL